MPMVDLPLALLGAPVSIGALLETGSRSPGAEPQCVSLFYVIDHWFNIRPRARIRVTELPVGVTYLPFTFSSDAGYANLPLALLGAPP
jgi:hypothetical protein